MLEGHVGRIFFSRMLKGEDLAEAIVRRIEEKAVKAGVFMVIGTLEKATLGYYKEGVYKYIYLDGPLEIASCMGNIAVDEKDNVMIHAHLVVTNEKDETFGGHLMKGSLVGATAELMVIEAVGVNLQRTFDEKTKLNILKLS